MSVMIIIGIVAVLALLGSVKQCDARHPQKGTRCVMGSSHKWGSPAVEGMYHTDSRGRRWRA